MSSNTKQTKRASTAPTDADDNDGSNDSHCFDAFAKNMGAGIYRLYAATMQSIHNHPVQSILMIYIVVLSCSCINSVLCDLEPRPDNNHFDDDDDDAARTLVSIFEQRKTNHLYLIVIRMQYSCHSMVLHVYE